jgi:acetyl-CoA carboxylase biotin carboxylase subunit
MPIRKVLIANRGEIAVRIIRAVHELGLNSVAVYSTADRVGLHVRMAEEAVPIGPPPAAESYLRIDRLIEAAHETGADAIHPGYGFLAENPTFAREVVRAGLVFIGPSGHTMELTGNKLAARATAARLGVPVVPGSPALGDPASARAAADEIGYPVMLKAAAGGGGKGMRIVRSAEELERALALTRGEAASAFGDDEVYLEKLIERPHHVEIQILCDAHGNAVYLGERDCSVQRRHQKLVEETPSPLIGAKTRAAMGEAALKLAREVGYVNAGTVEFMVDDQQHFYFLEVNTRLQVEHPITEMVTGLDIVREQIAIADGKRLAIDQDKVAARGAAIECRISAEDPENDFLPSLGTITRLRFPSGPGVRNDAGIYLGFEIPIYYDPLLAKLIVWGRNREEARQRLHRSLREYVIEGLRTNLPFHRWIVDHPRFARGEYHTGFIADEWKGKIPGNKDEETLAMIAAAVQAMEDRRRTATAPVAAGEANGEGGSRWRFRTRAARTRG